MAETIKPFEFIPHRNGVGHSMAIGQTGSGKTVAAELVKLWSVGHPSGNVLLAQADDNDGK